MMQVSQNKKVAQVLILIIFLSFILLNPVRELSANTSLKLTAGVIHLPGIQSFKTVIDRNLLPDAAKNFTKITVQSSNAPFHADVIGIDEFVGRPEVYQSSGYNSSLPFAGTFYVLSILYDDNRNVFGYHETTVDITGSSPEEPTPDHTQSPAQKDPLAYGSDIDPNYNLDTAPPLFSDVSKDHWAYVTIKAMAEQGVLGGYPDGKFRPEHVVTRGELAKIMVLAAGLQPSWNAKSSFADIKPTDWYSPYVESAKGYLSGYLMPNGQIHLNAMAPATREDIAVAVVKLKGYHLNRFPDLSLIQVMFKDYNGISLYARNNVALAVEHGLMSGFPDETFKPQMPLTRAQAAAILYRAYQAGNDNKVGFDSDSQSHTDGSSLEIAKQQELIDQLTEQIKLLQQQLEENKQQTTPVELLDQISHLQSQLNELTTPENQQPVTEEEAIAEEVIEEEVTEEANNEEEESEQESDPDNPVE